MTSSEYPPTVVALRCPPLRDYDAATIKTAGNELAELIKTKPTAVTPSMIADYKLLRDQCRAFDEQRSR